MHKFRYVLCGLLTITSAASQAETMFSSGLFYLHGQTSTTDQTPISAWSVPLSISHREQAWLVRASTAWLQQSSEDNATQTVNGLGDTHLSLGYTFQQLPNLQLSVKYKLATGDENKGLSTGENDLGFQLDYFQPLNPQYATFASVGYSLNGKPTQSDVQNTGYVSLGLGKNITARWQVGLSIDYQQSLYASLEDQTALSLFAGYLATDQTSWGLMTSYDNTETLSVGVSYQHPF